jgi:hypothetical protein
MRILIRETGLFAYPDLVPRGLTLLHFSSPVVYSKEMTQLHFCLGDHTGGAARWTTCLASAAWIPNAPIMASEGQEI